MIALRDPSARAGLQTGLWWLLTLSAIPCAIYITLVVALYIPELLLDAPTEGLAWLVWGLLTLGQAWLFWMWCRPEPKPTLGIVTAAWLLATLLSAYVFAIVSACAFKDMCL